MIIYMLEKVYNWDDAPEFLGLFSSIENAELAANNDRHLPEYRNDIEKLKFERVNAGDMFLEAKDTHQLCTYTIYEQKVDRFLEG